MSKQTLTQRIRTFSRANMVVGIVAFAVAVYLMITGEYANLFMRLQTETILDRVAIGGLLYTAAFWYVDMFLGSEWAKAQHQ